MANSYTQIVIHSVFAVKYREAQIDKAWKQDLYSYMGGILSNMGHQPLKINGVEDHVHVLFGMKPTLSISDTMRDLKSNSSKWLNEIEKTPSKFAWQDGYGAFAVSKTHQKALEHYIEIQEIHHQKTSFRNEYLKILTKNDVSFDEQWIFQDLL
jgi:putative transposase